VELHRGNAATIQVEFEAARNAPGLFVAAHPDGTAITPDAPAHPGEGSLYTALVLDRTLRCRSMGFVFRPMQRSLWPTSW